MRKIIAKIKKWYVSKFMEHLVFATYYKDIQKLVLIYSSGKSLVYFGNHTYWKDSNENDLDSVKEIELYKVWSKLDQTNGYYVNPKWNLHKCSENDCNCGSVYIESKNSLITTKIKIEPKRICVFS